MKTVTILGATGSVGSSTLDLIEREPEAFEVIALTANCDVERLAAAAIRTRAKFAAVADERCLPDLRDALRDTNIGTGGGPEAICEAAAMDADWTMAAIVGCAGLKPVMTALGRGRAVALANKEALVSAGDVMTAASKSSGAAMLPVDSEHNAIFQCLETANRAAVRRIVLTASGGPFRDWSLQDMATITPEQAVAHPNWSMGAKISVDSATMMNKGLELIEASHLFAVGSDKLDVIVHRQSVIHSMVEYVDGSMLAQMGPPDMRVPIAHALAWPKRMATPLPPLDLAAIARLDFEAADQVRFPALRLARSVEAGGARPAILNAANGVAVAAFLDRRIAFLEIAAIVEDTLELHYDPDAPDSLDAVLDVDAMARQIAGEREDQRSVTQNPGLLFSLLAFILVLGPLVFVHEFGHYFAGRIFGVKAEVFSIGFGREIFGLTDKRGTRWKFGWLPLGGYVKFAGDMNAASQPSAEWLQLPPTERAKTFPSKPLWQRAIIVAAGPVVNFLLAIVILGGFALAYGDSRTPATARAVFPGSAAAVAGIKPGDRIVALDGRPVAVFDDVVRYISIRPGENVAIGVTRGDTPMTITAKIGERHERDRFGNDYRLGRIGIFAVDPVRVPVPWYEAPVVGVQRTASIVTMMVDSIGQIITGRRSVKELGGPIKIAQVAGQQLTLGWEDFVGLIALISINLGFINLLPVPMLDGGHLLFYAVEAARRRPVEPIVQEWAFRGGLAAILALMLLVTFNDLLGGFAG